MESTYDSFPNYTEAMYLGNEPAGNGHEHVNGGFCERWECKWGGAETYNGKIIHAQFSLNPKVTIYICGDSLWLMDIRHSGKPEFWEYCVNHCGFPGYPCCLETNRHKLEPEQLEKYLHTVIPNCKLWDMVQARAFELCEMAGDPIGR